MTLARASTHVCDVDGHHRLELRLHERPANTATVSGTDAEAVSPRAAAPRGHRSSEQHGEQAHRWSRSAAAPAVRSRRVVPRSDSRTAGRWLTTATCAPGVSGLPAGFCDCSQPREDGDVPYDVLDASTWDVAGLETDGLTEHQWLLRPGDDRPWLFKAVVRHGERRQGEDWVEKVASAIAAQIAVPHAKVELARRGAIEGCVVRDVKAHQWQWYSGADLLSGLLGSHFDPRDRLARGHRLDTIAQALHDYGAAPGSEPARAFECFAGYLLLDAVIANRDRHPRNWAVMHAPAGATDPDALSPTFDHASGLGFSLSDGERERWLDGPGIRAWAERGSAKSFEHGPKPWPSLVAVAAEALAMCSLEVRGGWLAQLSNLSDDIVRNIVDSVPGLSAVTATFTCLLVTTNRDRLLELHT